MQRYLLFDSGCASCAALAQRVEHESEGWLLARSLHDDEIQNMLTHRNPNWKWEPMLVQVEDENYTIFSGMKMRTEMVRGLGLRKAWAIWRLTRSQQNKRIVYPNTLSRRQLGKLGLAALLAGFLFRVGSNSVEAACGDCSCVVFGSWYCGRQCSPPDCPYYDRKRTVYHLCCTNLNNNCYTSVEYICWDCSC